METLNYFKCKEATPGDSLQYFCVFTVFLMKRVLDEAIEMCHVCQQINNQTESMKLPTIFVKERGQKLAR